MAAKPEVPLVVDLDGTLVKTDLLWESVIALIKTNPFLIFLIPVWLIAGRASLKTAIARRSQLNINHLPYFNKFLEFLKHEHERGRMLILATAADRSFADRIAADLGIFSEVLASGHGTNLKGRNKLRALVDRFGERGFDYAGNCPSDLSIWASANGAIVVNGSKRLVKQAQKLVRINGIFKGEASRVNSLVRALRPSHWSKNVLVFVPLLTAHKLATWKLFGESVCAFLAFGSVASAVYLINDLFDLEHDRQDPTKKCRPLAAGDLPIYAALIAVPVLLLISVGLSLVLPARFLFVIVVYFGLTSLYSLKAKKVVVLDVIVLALAYTARIFAGGTATGISISEWLLTFSMFMFLSLAFAKRVSELQRVDPGEQTGIKGRSYLGSDFQHLANIGSTTGYVSILVFALYINSPEVTTLYKYSPALWLIVPLLLYWIGRFWFLLLRGEISGEPLLFVMKDGLSYWIGFLVFCVMAIAAF
jgi:4-hydroxybenzoate polyprenyltransferase